jgi:hypothetical protein
VVSGSPGSRTLGMSDLRYGTPLLFLENDIRHFCWNWSIASFSCNCCSVDNSYKVTSMILEYQTSWSTRMLHQACQKVCWRKISTSCQAHNKPNKAGLTHVAESEACQSIFLKLTKDEKQSDKNLELAGWYQKVLYLRLQSQSKRYIAIKSYLSANWASFGNFKTCKQDIAECMK